MGDNKQKIYVIDTSSVIEQKECIEELAKGGNIVVIPKQVVHELDSLKLKNPKGSDLNFLSREANQMLYELRNSGSINHNLEDMLSGKAELEACAKLKNGGYLFWEANHASLEGYFDKKCPDNQILATAVFLKDRARSRGLPVTVITEDKNLQLKVDSENIGIGAESLRMGKLDLSEGHYKGYCKVFVEPSVIDDFIKSSDDPKQRFVRLPDLRDTERSKILDKGSKPKFYWNEGIILVNKECNDQYYLAKVDYSDNGGGKAVALKFAQEWTDREKKHGYNPISLYGFRPGDPLQVFALEYILDPAVKMIILDGKAATGKTRLMITGSVSLILSSGSNTKFKEEVRKVASKLNFNVPNFENGLILARPEYASSDFEVGTMPGDMEEKIAPWLMPYFQALRRMTNEIGFDCYDQFQLKGMLEVLPTSLLRGINIEKAIGLIDELQNGNRHFAKTLLSRFEDSAKGILAGDITQIDNQYVGPRNNALTIIRETCKGEGPNVAMITLDRNYRGAISKLAEKI